MRSATCGRRGSAGIKRPSPRAGAQPQPGGAAAQPRAARVLRARLDADPQRPAEQAVDPTLSVLRIDQQGPFGYEPRGVFAVFGVHPTALINDTGFYSGDLFGYATREVVQRLRADTART